MNRDKELYRQLRNLSWPDLWTGEVPRFNSATARERLERVAVIRAAAVVFSESGPPNQLADIKTWLHFLLNDPQEKIRRYAIAALPKLARDPDDEKQLLTLAKKPASDREKKHVAAALSKIGGRETLQHADTLSPRAVQRIQATVLRAETASAINLNAPFTDFRDIEILLRCRAGLETILRNEIEDFIRLNRKFRLRETKTALIILTPIAPFALSELHQLRCFSDLAFSGTARLPPGRSPLDALAKIIASPTAQKIFQTFTTGPVRYRLDFVNKGHQRAAVRDLAERIYSLDPNLINGGGDTPWTIEIHQTSQSARIALVPKINPDPRFTYRRRDIPAASHPPIAACMARLSIQSRRNRREEILTSSAPASVTRSAAEIIWDPFCGSGLELIERALLGNVSKIIGTDLSPTALEIAQQNFSAAKIQNVQTEFIVSDFRNFDPGPISLIITNPPMGKRVPIPDLRQLIADLFNAAARFLKPGGALIFANPITLTPTDARLKRDFSQLIDFGGFHCRLEKYFKT